MPTTRAYSFLAAAAILYLFANQTQVGWLYVVSALLAGVVAAAWFANRRALRGLSVARTVRAANDANDLYEDGAAAVDFRLRGDRGGALLSLTETCPLAAPDSAQHTQRLFVPDLPAEGEAALTYALTLDRRGLHTFPPVAARSTAPFGFFARATPLTAPTRVLVYPDVRPLERLPLLDRRLNAQTPHPRPGTGYEIMGVRPYRSGDSPRHIHWRSSARTGQLMTKEFSDETQPGLTLALDVFAHPCAVTESKHTPFEWGVKCAASIADYARRKGYPLHLALDAEAIPFPRGAVDWLALLQVLARVQPTGARPLTHILRQPGLQAFAALILPHPADEALGAVVDLRQRGVEVLAVLLDPATFPAGGISAEPLAGLLQTQGAEVRVVAFGQNWAEQL